jgi:hypothetical protein
MKEIDRIRVVAIRLLSKDRSLRAFADIEIGGWIIYDWRILKQHGSRAYVSPPQVSWRDLATNQLKFKPILTLPGDLMQRIQTEILHAYHQEIEKRHDPNQRSAPIASSTPPRGSEKKWALR